MNLEDRLKVWSSPDRQPLSVHYNDQEDILYINGHRYAGELFRAFCFGPGKWFRVLERKNVVTVYSPPEQLEGMFDAVTLFDRLGGNNEANPTSKT